jgi:hypothetical protein
MLSTPQIYTVFKEFREFEKYYIHLRWLKKCVFPTGKDYEMYMRDILNMFDYYVRSGCLSRFTAYRLGGWELAKHWRQDRPLFLG